MDENKTLCLLAENKGDISKAGRLLKNGQLVVIPTETVYGLAANALNENAVAKIFLAKGRPQDNPLIVHVNSIDEIAPLVLSIPKEAAALAKAFWPGALTIILEKSPLVPCVTSGGLATVAVRVPSHPCARAVIKAAGCPLAAPSANISGKPSPTEFAHAWNDMNGKVAAVINGGGCTVGLESTVITLAQGKPKILRPGAVTREEIEAVIGKVEVDPAIVNALEKDTRPASPGMKYKHYAPQVQLVLSQLSLKDTASLANKEKAGALCFNGEEPWFEYGAVAYGGQYSSKSQAQGLFTALHKLDTLGVKTVYARAPQKNGVGLAVYNRLIRAAGFNVRTASHVIIGLTGQTGAGKTVAAQEFKNQGAAVIDCDAITKEPAIYHSKCIKQLQNAFGSDIIISGELNRKLLAERAFETPEKAAILSSITLPVITKEINKRVQLLCENGSKVIVLDAPTLFEAGANAMCTHVVTVVADEKIRINRIIQRDNISVAEAQKRISVQKSADFFKSHGDYVINSNKGDTLEQAKIIYINICGG